MARLSKLIETFWLFWAFSYVGIHNCMVGPTLLDLQLLLEKDLDALSYLFLASGLGSVLGSLAAGFPRFDLRLQLFLALAVGCVAVASIPQVHHLAYMYFMVFMFGLTRGLVACFVIQIAAGLWEEKEASFHFIVCGASLGSILAPLIAKPFLCSHDPVSDVVLTNISELDTSFNITGMPYRLDYVEKETPCTSKTTQVEWVFILLGCYMLPVCLAQLYYWLSYRMKRIEEGSKSVPYAELKHDEEQKLSSVYVLFFFALFLMYMLLSALAATYPAVLTVYGVKGPLKMRKSDMVMMTSLFWCGSLFSRICSAIFIRYFNNFKDLVVHMVCLAISAVLFLALGNLYPEALWVLSVCIGFCYAPSMGGIMVWVNEFGLLLPKTTSLCFLASGVGAMIFPFLGGLLFDYFGARSFLYTIFGIICSMCIVFTCLKIISKSLPLCQSNSEIKN